MNNDNDENNDNILNTENKENAENNENVENNENAENDENAENAENNDNNENNKKSNKLTDDEYEIYEYLKSKETNGILSTVEEMLCKNLNIKSVNSNFNPINQKLMQV